MFSYWKHPIYVHNVNSFFAFNVLHIAAGVFTIFWWTWKTHSAFCFKYINKIDRFCVVYIPAIFHWNYLKLLHAILFLCSLGQAKDVYWHLFLKKNEQEKNANGFKLMFRITKIRNSLVKYFLSYWIFQIFCLRYTKSAFILSIKIANCNICLIYGDHKYTTLYILILELLLFLSIVLERWQYLRQ